MNEEGISGRGQAICKRVEVDKNVKKKSSWGFQTKRKGALGILTGFLVLFIWNTACLAVPLTPAKGTFSSLSSSEALLYSPSIVNSSSLTSAHLSSALPTHSSPLTASEKFSERVNDAESSIRITAHTLEQTAEVSTAVQATPRTMAAHSSLPTKIFSYQVQPNGNLPYYFAEKFPPQTLVNETLFTYRGENPHRDADTIGSTHQTSEEKPSFLFIGMSGIDINAVDFANPVISAQIDKSAIASMTTRSVPLFTCPSEGWMALGVAGDAIDTQGRADALESADRCSPFTIKRLSSPTVSSSTSSPTESPASFPESSENQASAGSPASLSPESPFTQENKQNNNGIGKAIVENFAELSASLTWPRSSAYEGAVGIGPGAALTLANSSGEVSQWTDFPEDIDTLANIFASNEGNIFIDLGAVRAEPGSLEYEEQVAALMGRLTKVLEAADIAEGANSATATRMRVISSLADPWNRGTLQFVAVSVPDSVGEYNGITAGTGVIHSASTRTTGFISLSDLREFLQGKHSSLHVESVSTTAQARDVVAQFVEHSYVARQANANWYKVFNLVVALGVVGALILFLVKPAPSDTSRGLSKKMWNIVAMWNIWSFSFIPAAFLLNFTRWWSLPLAQDPKYSGMIAVGLTIVIAATITLISLFTPSPVGTVALISLTILSVDVMCGSLHQRNGFMGSLVLTSRRFYGVSNRTYLVLVVAGLLACLAWFARKSVEHRRQAGMVIALTGAMVLAVDAVPSWGADFGGPPGIIAAFGVAALLVAGIRLRWWHGIVWLGLTVAVMGAVAFSDTQRGETSHIGRFWDSLGTEENFSLVAGKIRDVLRSFTARPTTTVTLVVMAVLVLLMVFVVRTLGRRGSVHMATLKTATQDLYFVPLLLACVIGILVAIPINDSGALMLKEGVYIAAPAFVALIAGNLAKRDFQLSCAQ